VLVVKARWLSRLVSLRRKCHELRKRAFVVICFQSLILVYVPMLCFFFFLCSLQKFKSLYYFSVNSLGSWWLLLITWCFDSIPTIAVITVEPADKISFVYNCMQPRLRGQFVRFQIYVYLVNNRPFRKMPWCSFVCPPKFCISIVFIFSSDHCNSQEKLETMLTQNLGGRAGSIVVFSEVAYSFYFFWRKK